MARRVTRSGARKIRSDDHRTVVETQDFRRLAVRRLENLRDEHLGGPSICHHSAAAEQDDPVCPTAGQVEIVEHQHGRQIVFEQPVDAPQDLPGSSVVLRGRRLVQKRHASTLHQRAREVYPLPLPARDRADRAARQVLDAHRRQKLARSLDLVTAGETQPRHLRVQTHQHCIEHGETKGDVQTLLHQRNSSRAFRRGHRSHVAPTQRHRAGRPRLDPGQRPKQRRLAGTIRSEDRNPLSRADLHIDTVEQQRVIQCHSKLGSRDHIAPVGRKRSIASRLPESFRDGQCGPAGERVDPISDPGHDAPMPRSPHPPGRSARSARAGIVAAASLVVGGPAIADVPVGGELETTAGTDERLAQVGDVDVCLLGDPNRESTESFDPADGRLFAGAALERRGLTIGDSECRHSVTLVHVESSGRIVILVESNDLGDRYRRSFTANDVGELLDVYDQIALEIRDEIRGGVDETSQTIEGADPEVETQGDGEDHDEADDDEIAQSGGPALRNPPQHPSSDAEEQDSSRGSRYGAEDNDFQWFPWIGFNVSSLSYTAIDYGGYNGPRVSPSLGVGMRWRGAMRVGLQTEINFNSAGAAYAYSYISYVTALDYLSVPVMARFRIANRRRDLHITAGLQPSLLLSARYQKSVPLLPIPIESEGIGDYMNRTELGILAGFQMQLRSNRRNPDRRREMEFRYTQGATSIAQEGPAVLNTQFSVHFRVFR